MIPCRFIWTEVIAGINSPLFWRRSKTNYQKQTTNHHKPQPTNPNHCKPCCPTPSFVPLAGELSPQQPLKARGLSLHLLPRSNEQPKMKRINSYQSWRRRLLVGGALWPCRMKTIQRLHNVSLGGRIRKWKRWKINLRHIGLGILWFYLVLQVRNEGGGNVFSLLIDVLLCFMCILFIPSCIKLRTSYWLELAIIFFSHQWMNHRDELQLQWKTHTTNVIL